MQYIVTQEPKRKYRAGYVVKVVVVEAKSKRGALAMTARYTENEQEFCKPVAQALELDRCYRL